LFGVVLASCLVTFWVQRAGGAMQNIEFVPWSYRLANVPVSYVRYLGKTFWPVDLAAFYPLPQMSEQAAIQSGRFFAWALVATILLLLVSLAVFLLRQRAPYLLVGWLWYLGTLVPVIGLVQVGEQAMADRYTYVPLLGIFVMVVWGVADLAARFRVPNLWLANTSLLLLAICAIASWRQIGYWRNTQTLFERAIEVTPLNSRAHNILGAYLAQIGRADEGKRHLRAALAISPRFYPSLNNLGMIYAAEHHDAEAAECYREALRIHPDSVVAHLNLGNIYARRGELDKAVPEYVDVLRIVSDNPQLNYQQGQQARSNLSDLLPSGGTVDQAVNRFKSLSPRLTSEQLAQVRAFYTALLARDSRFERARQAISRFDATGH
jgi:hypothetical protein